MDDTEQLIEKLFETLPNEARTFLNDSTWQKNIDAIAKKHFLNQQKADALKMEVFLTSIGLQSPAELAKNIMNTLGLSSTSGNDILDELRTVIPEEIFGYGEHMVDIIDHSQPEGQIPQKPKVDVNRIGNVERMVSVPAYGVERPASSYTSILPRATNDNLKIKDTPTAESLIQKVGVLSEKAMTEPLPPTKNAPVPENLPVLLKDEPAPFILSKLNTPTNIPQHEMEIFPPPKPKPEAPKYPAGQDPYRESTTP